MQAATLSLLDAVENIRPVLEKYGPEAELERRLPTPVYDAMLAAGLFRIPVPKAYGGLELHPTEAFQVWEAVAKIDSAAAWNLVIGSVAICFLPYLPQAAGEEVFAAGPDVVFAGANSTPAAATRVEGGWRVTGRVAFASGCDRADWFFFSAVVMEDGEPKLNPATGLPVSILGYVPRSDVQIIDTWRSSGMRGSGSSDFVLDDAFLPEHRSGTLAPLRDPPPAFSGPLYRLGIWQAFHGETLVSLGAASAAVEKLIGLAQTKTPVRASALLRERAMAQHHVARAQALVDAGQEYIYASMSAAYSVAHRGGDLTPELKMRLQLAACFGAEAATQAVDLVHEAAGTSAIRDEFGIERHFRDIHALSQHTNKSYMRYESVGKLLFGLPTDWFVLNL